MAYSIPTPDGGSITLPDAKEVEILKAEGIRQSGIMNDWADAIIRAAFEAMTWFMSLVTQLLDLVIAALGQLFLSGQGADKPAFYVLVGTIIEDLLGVPVEATTLIAAQNKDGRTAAMEKVGESLYTRLQSEFTQGGGISEEQGLKAAESFLGFLMAFSIRQGNVAVLGDLKYLPFSDGFREYGESMARNLGLGRLARNALKPMINTLIATPLQWNLNRQYRPAKPAESVLVRAYRQGQLSQPDFQAEMERIGYTDAYIQIVLNENGFKFPDATWQRLVRFGIVAQADAVTGLRASGLTQDEAQASLNAVDYGRQDSRWAEYVNTLESSYVQGQISLADFNSLLASVPITSGERDLEGQIVQEKRRAGTLLPSFSQVQAMYYRGDILLTDLQQWLLEQNYSDVWRQRLIDEPGAEVTLAQAQKAYMDGIIDITVWRAYLKRKGYGSDDADLLTLQLLSDFSKAGTKSRTKGLTLASLTKALKTGLMDLDTFKATLLQLGYGKDAIDLLAQEAEPTP